MQTIQVTDPTTMRTASARCVFHRVFLAACILVISATVSIAEEKPSATIEEDAPKVSPEHAAFFETKIRPILANNCYECHGEDEQEGDLRLDSLSGVLSGGSLGPAVERGNIEKSALVKAIKYDDDDLQMPPDAKLSETDIELLTKWVEMGAPWPNAGKIRIESKHGPKVITDKDRQFWSFQPRVRPKVPKLEQDPWVISDVDAFIRTKQIEKNLAPSPKAGKRELIRRAYFDLIGLPPTHKEVLAFEADTSPDAFEKLVDRLLAMPQYGERWGRHWLDLVRYGQTNGYERDDEKPYAWRYRDYVIRAFNEDKPYDQFIKEQLAGDELDEVTDDSITATGFYRLGVWDDEPDTILQAYYDGLDDMVVTTGTAFLGVTIGCARCHDHKFDPISNEDYYRMTAFIRNVRYYCKPNEDGKNQTIFTPLPSGNGRALSVHEYGRVARKTQVLIKGSANSLGKEVHPRFIEVVCKTNEAALPIIPEPSEDATTSGRRRVLAEWIASADNPLTARVMANRLWHYHFGRGIVNTPSDFGVMGGRPTHPKLLDWLASELVDGDWQLKRMHKLIMLSSTYQQSSRAENKLAISVDPGNNLLWRQHVRRLEAETIRDSVLAVSGKINLEMGGPSFYPNLTPDVLATQSMPGRGWASSTDSERARRGVYIFAKRSLRIPMLDIFDLPTNDSPVSRRDSTTVAPQALTLLNSEFMQEQAGAYADRLVKEAGTSPEDQIRQAYRHSLTREPTDKEVRVALAYLKRQATSYDQVPLVPTLEPRLPSALHKSYLEKTRAIDFLDGPRVGWSYFMGDWPARGDSIHWYQRERGPFALWDPVKFSDGTIQTRLYLHPNSDVAGLLFRANAEGDLFHGYELLFDSPMQTISIRRHGKSVTTLQSVKLRSPAARWADVRIDLSGDKIRVWLDGADKPLLEATDSEPLKTAGHLGLRTWGSELSFKDLTVEANGKTVDVESFDYDANEHLVRLPGWDYFGGEWKTDTDGTYSAKTDDYRYAAWLDPQLSDGTVECDLMATEGADAQLLLRVNKPRRGVDTFFGYEVAINAKGKFIRFAKHENDFQRIIDVPYDIQPGRWYHLKVELDGARVKVFVDGNGKPVIDKTDAKPLKAGKVALRTGGEARFGNLRVVSGNRTWVANFTPEKVIPETAITPEHRALTAFCNIMLNLNEFLYVD